MAAWTLQHYKDILGSPAKVAYIELGPGRGTLAQQMLAALAMMSGGDELLAAMHVHLVEVSHDLRQVQADALQCSDIRRVSEVRPGRCTCRMPACRIQRGGRHRPGRGRPTRCI